MEMWSVYSEVLCSRDSLSLHGGFYVATQEPSERPRIALEVRGQAQRLVSKPDLVPIPWPNDYDHLSQKVNRAFRDMWLVLAARHGMQGFHLKSHTSLNLNLDIVFSGSRSLSTPPLNIGKVRFLLSDSGDVDEDKLSAALSLWHYSLHSVLALDSERQSIWLVGIFKDKAEYRSRSQSTLRGWSGKQEQRSFVFLKFSNDRIYFLPYARTGSLKLENDLPIFGLRNIDPLKTEDTYAVGFLWADDISNSWAGKRIVLEIIHNWLSDIAPYIDRIDLETARIIDDPNGDPMLECGPVNDLCRCLYQSGFFRDPRDTRMFVLSILIKHDLLPIPEDLGIPEDSDSEEEEEFFQDPVHSEDPSSVDSTNRREEAAQADVDEITDHQEPTQAYVEDSVDYSASGNEESLEYPIGPEHPSSANSTNLREVATQTDVEENTDRQDIGGTSSTRHPSSLHKLLSTAANGAVKVAASPYLGVKKLKNIAARRSRRDATGSTNAEAFELHEREGNTNPASLNDAPAESRTED